MPTVNQEAISTHLLPTVGGLSEEAGVGQQMRGCPDRCHSSTGETSPVQGPPGSRL